MSVTTRELRSEVTPGGELRLSIEEREVSSPGPDEVVVRVEAAPVNPADLAALIGLADVATLTQDATGDRLVTTAEVTSASDCGGSVVVAGDRRRPLARKAYV